MPNKFTRFLLEHVCIVFFFKIYLWCEVNYDCVTIRLLQKTFIDAGWTQRLVQFMIFGETHYKQALQNMSSNHGVLQIKMKLKAQI